MADTDKVLWCQVEKGNVGPDANRNARMAWPVALCQPTGMVISGFQGKSWCANIQIIDLNQIEKADEFFDWSNIAP